MLGIQPDELLARLIIILIAIPIHELSHGLAARWLGDPTPEQQGRLTLNPVAHLDIIGTLMILFAGFGWGRPIPVNPMAMHRIRNKRAGMALTALAGPLSNIIMAMILALPVRLGLFNQVNASVGEHVFQVLLTAIAINIVLAAFNLLPFPPLDGFRILAGVVPRKVALALDNLEPYAYFILITILFVLPRLGLDIVRPLLTPLYQFLGKIVFL